MANEMLMGLLNQTSGGNWWQGNGAPTSGYGSFTPAPPQSQPAEQPATSPSGEPTQPSQAAPGQQTNPDQWKIDLVQNNANQRAQMFQRELDQLRIDQSSYPPGSERWNKYQMQIQQKMLQMQAEMNRVGGMV